MPEFILPAEADHCPHCGQVLRDPPDCCEPMRREYEAEFLDSLQRGKWALKEGELSDLPEEQ